MEEAEAETGLPAPTSKAARLEGPFSSFNCSEADMTMLTVGQAPSEDKKLPPKRKVPAKFQRDPKS